MRPNITVSLRKAHRKKVYLMTIKRRLFISNIMMLVIPVVLGVAVFCVILLTLMGFFNINFFDLFGESDDIKNMIEQVRSYSVEWSRGVSEEHMQADMDILNNMLMTDQKYENMSIAVYRGGVQLHTAGFFYDTPLLPLALSESGSHNYLKNHIFLYATDAGEYKIILMDADYWLVGGTYYINNWELIEELIIAVFVVIIVITLVSTRFLSQMVFKSIMTPLDTLVYGVHQIRDGNLDYRIKYGDKDEFCAVCADFNEMAERLSDMVSTRQKDEENRKELIAGISHDLRTPLTSILTYVEGIEIGLASTPQIERHYLATIKNKAMNLEHIVSQLFLLAKLDIGEFPMQMRRIDIGCWLAGFISSVSEEYGQKGLLIELVENVQSAEASVDVVQFGNVLTNIMDNSLKYSDKHQKITRIFGWSDSGNVIISISDNGPGVPDESLEKLFNMFYRGDKARRDVSCGSGLGLAISAKIIERFDGTIKAENSTGGGLTVIVTLPVAKGAELL